MKSRHPIFIPIAIGAMAIAFTVTILVAWALIFTQFYIVSSKPAVGQDLGVGYWMILSIGCLFLLLIVVAIVLFLVSNIRQSNYVHKQNAFIDSVTHELKSPLASLRIGLETLERHQLDPQMKGRFIGMMKKDVDRLKALIDHVLEAGRLEHERRALNSSATDLRGLIDSCAAQIRYRYDLDETQLVTTLSAEENRSVLIDPVALETVLLNLLDNGVKYSGDRIDVHLDATAEAETLTIAIRDQGLGIPKQQLKKVFERFFRVEREGEANKVRGTGLGLYVVSLLVKRMEGRIQVHSEGESKGTLVTIELPLRWCEATEAESTGKDEGHGATGETVPARG